MNNQVSNIDMHKMSDIISEVSDEGSELSFESKDIKEIPKKTLHPVVFLLNILWMLLSCHAILFYVYGTMEQIEEKGKLAAVALGFTVCVASPTFLYLAPIKNLLKLTILIDTILAVTIAAAIAFISLILIFDKTHEWYWSIIEAGFAIELVFYSTMVRVMLVHMNWSKWKLIIFKLHAMMNCLMFFICGVYFILVDFSYTQHMLKSFDDKVHDFMVLFIFTMFSFAYELYSKITDLDHTAELRYIYMVKNCDENLPKKKNSIIKQKRDSVNNLKILRKSLEFGLSNPPTVRISKRLSKFAHIESLN